MFYNVLSKIRSNQKCTDIFAEIKHHLLRKLFYNRSFPLSHQSLTINLNQPIFRLDFSKLPNNNEKIFILNKNCKLNLKIKLNVRFERI